MHKNFPGKHFKADIIDDATGECIGQISTSKVVVAHLRGNYYPFIRKNGQDIACSIEDRDNGKGKCIYIDYNKRVYL